MKFSDFTKSMSLIEMVALVIFIIYLVYPFKTPEYMKGSINSPLGLVSMFIVTLFLFLYTNPFLGIIYIFVAYELLRRSSVSNKRENIQVDLIPHVSSNQRINQELPQDEYFVDNIIPDEMTLEEEVIRTYVPERSHFVQDENDDDSFLPVFDHLVGASVV